LKDYFSLVKLMLDENCKRIFEIIVRLFESFEGIYKKQWKWTFERIINATDLTLGWIFPEFMISKIHKKRFE